MAQLTCSSCGLEAEDGDLVCRGCAGNLSRPAVGCPPAAGARPAPEEPHRRCPHCGAPVVVPTNRVCVVCQRMLDEAPPPAGEDASRATRRDVPAVVLRIRFGAAERTVPPGGTLLLGRAPAAGATRGLLERHDNVSRRHATVGLEPDGTAWVRDEHSTNGTFVNEVPAVAGARTPLRDGDVLRLAADCTLGVAVDRPEEGGR
ncbi:FHA domain-containing protein [Kitasatospora phosalacinea]|uniref:FHA domain-containing protein n=1 Tax=Kitasatospora phosalacinea TaxID=2065 RepID=UPI00068DD663|nr:FHA domain-containing protein [Kitasatospora phosalacinea]